MLKIHGFYQNRRSQDRIKVLIDFDEGNKKEYYIKQKKILLR